VSANQPPGTVAGGEPGGEVDLDSMSVAEQTDYGAELDDIHITHRRQRFVVPGGKAEQRAERGVAVCFLLTFVASVAFIVIYIAAPWQYSVTNNSYAWYTPMLGVTMALALAGVGVGAVLWAKWLLPEEEVVQDRHDGPSPEVDRRTTVAALVDGMEGTGLARRSLLKRSLGLGLGALGALAVVPLGGLIKKPRGELFSTPWKAGARLVSIDGRPVRPGDMLPGALQTVFPGVPGGTKAPDAPTMLIRLRPDQTVQHRAGQEDFGWQDYVAYSKICTHAGCPVSLYEQQSGRILCPCHQSQFLVTKDALPVFGPAARPLPALAITVDEDGYFVARGDYREPIGPSFWERPT
jgi:ubiquinol-cytochrome c reductase iron-sulfur subunit